MEDRQTEHKKIWKTFVCVYMGKNKSLQRNVSDGRYFKTDGVCNLAFFSGDVNSEQNPKISVAELFQCLQFKPRLHCNCLKRDILYT